MSEEPLEGVVEPAPTPLRDRRALVWGAILVLAGIFFLLANLLPQGSGSVFLLVVGLAFLAAYFLGGRNVGFLIPGGIVSGLGLGVLLNSAVLPREYDGVVVLCLGLGFISIWLFKRGHFWSLFPGGILAAIGAILVGSELYGTDAGVVLRWWPLILVGLGLWVLLARVVRRAGEGPG